MFLAHVDVINAFDKLNSCIVPKRFLAEKYARDWFDEEEKVIQKIEENKVIYEGVDEEGNIIKLSVKNIKNAFTSLNGILEDEKFHVINEYIFNQ